MNFRVEQCSNNSPEDDMLLYQQLKMNLNPNFEFYFLKSATLSDLSWKEVNARFTTLPSTLIIDNREVSVLIS